jgi:hypothetical protein
MLMSPIRFAKSQVFPPPVVQATFKVAPGQGELNTLRKQGFVFPEKWQSGQRTYPMIPAASYLRRQATGSSTVDQSSIFEHFPQFECLA